MRICDSEARCFYGMRHNHVARGFINVLLIAAILFSGLVLLYLLSGFYLTAEDTKVATKVVANPATNNKPSSFVIEQLPNTTSKLAENANQPQSVRQQASLPLETPQHSTSSIKTTIKTDSSQNHISYNPDQQQSLSTAAENSYNSNDQLEADNFPGDDELFTIAGRVINEVGEAQAGVVVSATLRHLFQQNGINLSTAGTTQQQIWTDQYGFFLFEQVDNGEYEIRAEATENYAGASKVVRAGTDNISLVLTEERKMLIYGFVQDTQQQPLTEVRVIPMGLGGQVARTDDEGIYEVSSTIRGHTTNIRNAALRFSKRGYKEKRLTIDVATLNDGDEIRFDAELEPLQNVSSVSGVVMNIDGQTMAGEFIQLFSTSTRQRYQVFTDQAGEFLITDVELANDYQLWVKPRGGYQDYSQRHLAVTADGLSLEIILESLQQGDLVGQIVDIDLNPIPQFSLWLRNADSSMQRSLQVTSDNAGNFFIDSVTEGRLIFETRSYPQLSVSGIQIPSANQQNVNLILDWGFHELHGRVVDNHATPVSVPQITLSWSHQENGLRSRSMRRTAADAEGYFAFTQLGPGLHTININMPGFKRFQLDHEVGHSQQKILVHLEENVF